MLWDLDCLAADRRIEQIVVSCSGYAIAAYASIDPSTRRFVSYAKVCRDMPRSYWEAEQCFAKFASEGEHEYPSLAIADAIEVAVMSLANSGFARLA
jgi:hypothetical protein